MAPRTRFLTPPAALAIGLAMGLLSAGAAVSQPTAETRGAHITAQPVLAVQDLTGDWTGSIRFFDLAVAERVGELPMTLSFANLARPSGTGRIGAAALQVTQARAHRDRLEVTATLDRPSHIDAALAKQHLVVVITSVTPNRLTGEVHFKSNRVFDPRMREGYVVLERTGGR